MNQNNALTFIIVVVVVVGVAIGGYAFYRNTVMGKISPEERARIEAEAKAKADVEKAKIESAERIRIEAEKIKAQQIGTLFPTKLPSFDIKPTAFKPPSLDASLNKLQHIKFAPVPNDIPRIRNTEAEEMNGHLNETGTWKRSLM